MENDAAFRLGKFQFRQPLVVAPMAGVSDRVFRALCLDHGADYAVAEMIASNPRLRGSDKSRRRLEFAPGAGIRIVQIAGAEPLALAEAARHCVGEGADVIDINMGCPAKKVCNKAAGSALLRDESLVASLLSAVVNAVDVPVTLKFRTGWDPAHRNAPRIARLAEDVGVAALTIHGRTRACAFKGAVEYDTIAAVKQTVSIPVIANGDITDPAVAARVLAYTRCDGLMIGRAAYGNPWIFREMKAALSNAPLPAAPDVTQIRATMAAHVDALYGLYGERAGTRIARKHVGWYAARLPGGGALRQAFNRTESARAQLALINHYENNNEGAMAA